MHSIGRQGRLRHYNDYAQCVVKFLGGGKFWSLGGNTTSPLIHMFMNLKNVNVISIVKIEKPYSFILEVIVHATPCVFYMSTDKL